MESEAPTSPSAAAAAAADADDAAPIWKPGPLVGDDEVMQDQPVRGGTEGCWACQCLSLSAPTGRLEGLVRLFRDSIGLVSDRELATLLSSYYETQIRGPAAELTGEPGMPWPPEVAYAHVTTHLCEPTLVVNEQIRTLRGVIRELRKSLRRVNTVTGETSIDAKNVELLLKAQKALLDAFAKKPRDMLFFVEDAQLAAGQAGAVVRANPVRL